jgi:hypothetical protein
MTTHTYTNPLKADPLTMADLENLHAIDLVILDLLGTLRAISSVEIRNDLHRAGMPSLGAMIDLLQDALEQTPVKALQRLEEVAELVQLYSWALEHEGHHTPAQRLRKHWFEIDHLLRSVYPDEEREPWEDLQDAMQTRIGRVG